MTKSLVFLITFAVSISGCASRESIDLTKLGEDYTCLSPKIAAKVSRFWDMCPLMGALEPKPKYSEVWKLIPLTKVASARDEELASMVVTKLRSSEKRCSMPLTLEEVRYLKNSDKIDVISLTRYSNPSYAGIEIRGTIKSKGEILEVFFGQHSLEIADNELGYNLSEFFISCEQ